ncbi:MAG: serpin family protein [Muribaculaceae bacterium]|nr:serpin family protein [Muribaculaceae bacterium]
MKKLIPILVLSLLWASCKDPDADPKLPVGRDDIALSRAEEEIALATNAFSARLMGQLADIGASDLDGSMPDNFVVSPLSLSMALSMTANGTEGNTRSEILDVLGFEDADIAAANSLNSKLTAQLPKLDPKTKVSFANALWVDANMDCSLRPEFSEVLSKVYDAPTAPVNGLGTVEGMDIINSWSAHHTNNLIPRLLHNPLSPNSLMALTNALYFKGTWAIKFDKSRTSRADFYNSDGTSSRVDMMRKDALSAQAFEDEGYKAAAFGYGNGAYSLIVVMPDWGVNPAKAFAAIDPADLHSLVIDGSFTTRLDVKLPRFTVENGTDMIPVLKAMGIREAFTTAGDFSAMWASDPGEFFISTVLQRAKIVVDEEGSEAAATTIANGSLTSPGPVQSSDFIVDRPFAFAIVERSTGVILFAGVVNKL